MQASLKEIMVSIEDLKPLVQDNDLPNDTMWFLTDVWGVVVAEEEKFLAKRRRCCQKYGKINAETNVFEYVDENGDKSAEIQSQCEAAIEELLSQTIVDIPGNPLTYHKDTSEDMRPHDFKPRKLNAPDLPLTPVALSRLRWLIRAAPKEVEGLSELSANA